LPSVAPTSGAIAAEVVLLTTICAPAPSPPSPPPDVPTLLLYLHLAKSGVVTSQNIFHFIKSFF
jgi:hypothetical protein